MLNNNNNNIPESNDVCSFFCSLVVILRCCGYSYEQDKITQPNTSTLLLHPPYPAASEAISIPTKKLWDNPNRYDTSSDSSAQENQVEFSTDHYPTKCHDFDDASISSSSEDSDDAWNHSSPHVGLMGLGYSFGNPD